MYADSNAVIWARTIAGAARVRWRVGGVSGVRRPVRSVNIIANTVESYIEGVEYVEGGGTLDSIAGEDGITRSNGELADDGLSRARTLT